MYNMGKLYKKKGVEIMLKNGKKREKKRRQNKQKGIKKKGNKR